MGEIEERQAFLSEYKQPDLSELSDAERHAYETIEQGDTGVREYARAEGVSPGTVSNLLRRAREKLGDLNE